MTTRGSLVTAPAATESTPLLASPSQAADVPTAPPAGRFTPVRRLQLISYLMVVAMSMPNTSLLYLVRTMSCEGYYDEPGHEYSGHGDRCNVPVVEGLAAGNIGMMVSAQTLCCELYPPVCRTPC